jgi:hypothetical protein
MPLIRHSWPSVSSTNLLHNNHTSKLLHGSHNLLSILLWHTLLHQLRRTLDELLAVHQTQTQETLDLLDNLGLRSGVEGLELDVEEGLFLSGWGGFLYLGDWGGSWGSGGESTHRHVWDVEF